MLHDHLHPDPLRVAQPDAARRRLLAAGLALPAALLVLPAAAHAQPLPKPGPGLYTELRWDDLVPKGWDPMKGLRDKGITNPGVLIDGDPKTEALMS